MATKKYPFSAEKHGHDIEFVYNRLWLRREDAAMEGDWETYEKLGPQVEKLEALTCQMFGGVVWLTGPEIGLAKECVMLASNWRAESCIERGRYDLLKYC